MACRGLTFGNCKCGTTPPPIIPPGGDPWPPPWGDPPPPIIDPGSGQRYYSSMQIVWKWLPIPPVGEQHVLFSHNAVDQGGGASGFGVITTLSGQTKVKVQARGSSSVVFIEFASQNTNPPGLRFNTDGPENWEKEYTFDFGPGPMFRQIAVTIYGRIFSYPANDTTWGGMVSWA
jgi:hypothetical protein